jgi:transposase
LDRLLPTAHELDIALTQETRPYARKRLRALKLLLAGRHPEDIARLVKTSRTSVDRWIAMARQSGWRSILRDRRGQKPKLPIAAHASERMRRQIREGLEGAIDRVTRTRLIAVDRVLSGNPVEAAARAANVKPNTVMSWLAKVEHGGIAALRSHIRPAPSLCPQANSAELRALAASEPDPRAAKRLRVIAWLADGLSALEGRVPRGGVARR